MSVRQRWNKGRIIAIIRQLHREKQPLNSGHIQRHRLSLYSSSLRYFGSWKNAVEAAGLQYEKVYRKAGRGSWRWNRAIVIATIQQLHQAGDPLNAVHVQRHHHSLYPAAVKYCGGWGRAVSAAGIEYARVRKCRPCRSWSKAEVIRVIRSRRRRKLSLSTKAVSREDYGLLRAARRKFGKNGWRKALRAAGVNPIGLDPRIQWTRQRIMAEIHRRFALGLPLHQSHMTQNGYAGLFTAARRFYGSWSKTITAAGIVYANVKANRRGYWSKKRIVSEIRKLERQGVRLSMRATERSRPDLVGIALLYFGSWQAAVEAAGFNYLRHCLTWSIKAWLRTMTKTQVRGLERRTLKLAAERRRTT